MQLDVEVALQQFVKRHRAEKGKPRVDNARLPAGSPMYYYCKHCGVFTEVLDELHSKGAKTCCDPCRVLVDHGLVDEALQRVRNVEEDDYFSLLGEV